MSETKKIIRRETLIITAGVAVLSVLEQAVFVIIGYWSKAVLFGNILGAAVAVLNFYLMSRTVEKAVSKDEKGIKSSVRFSLTYRYLMMIAAASLAFFLPSVFSVFAVLPPYLFPNFIARLRPLIGRVFGLDSGLPAPAADGNEDSGENGDKTDDGNKSEKGDADTDE